MVEHEEVSLLRLGFIISVVHAVRGVGISTWVLVNGESPDVPTRWCNDAWVFKWHRRQSRKKKEHRRPHTVI